MWDRTRNRLRITTTAAMMSFAFLAATSAAAGSEKSELEKRIITEIIMAVDATSAGGVPMKPDTGDAAEYWRARGVGPTTTSAYRDFPTQKALAACVAWQASEIGNIVLRYWYGAVRHRHAESATQDAMFRCQQGRANKGVTDCECELVAKNHDLVLDVPKWFLEKAD